MNLPMSKELMKSYRDVLFVSSSPSQIDTNREINPSVVLNTSENPVNVAMVQRGTLKAEEKVVSVTGIGTFSIVFTCPDNKRRILKAYNAYTSTGTYTISACSLRISPSPAGPEGIIAYGTTGFSSGQVTTDIQQQEGSYVVFNITCSAHTLNGNFLARILYMEYDEDQI